MNVYTNTSQILCLYCKFDLESSCLTIYSTSISLSLIELFQLLCFAKNGKSGLDETVLKKYMTKLYPIL